MCRRPSLGQRQVAGTPITRTAEARVPWIARLSAIPACRGAMEWRDFLRRTSRLRTKRAFGIRWATAPCPRNTLPTVAGNQGYYH